MFRIEAADRPISDLLEIVRDPTGSPVAMYSAIIVCNIFSYRFSDRFIRFNSDPAASDFVENRLVTPVSCVK